jgi:fluoride ion exporter CrcB/FEX
MYTQFIGCMIMGYYAYFKPTMMAKNSHRLDKVHYVAVTTGLCGSITTFSSWMMDCNNNFYLQWDLSWGNVAGSYNSGRFFEWIMSMITGVAVPILALRLGRYLAKVKDERRQAQIALEKAAAPAVGTEENKNVMHEDGNTGVELRAPIPPQDINSKKKMSFSGDNNDGGKNEEDEEEETGGDKNTSVPANATRSTRATTRAIRYEVTKATRLRESAATVKRKSQFVRESTFNNRPTASSNAGKSFAQIASDRMSMALRVEEYDEEDEEEINEADNETTPVLGADENQNPSFSKSVAAAAPVQEEYKIFTYNLSELAVLATFFVCTFLLAGIPSGQYPTWMFLTWTGITGVFGAYLRYQLAAFNPIYPNFPLGTFSSNIAGTYLLAIFTVISKYRAQYYNVDVQAALFGLSTGFCGCLTTVSTFVNEIDALPEFDSYRYAITTNLVAQLGIVFILNIYAFSTIQTVDIQPSTINECGMSSDICGDLLTKLGCPANYIVNTACSNANNYNTYLGNCSCGSFNGNYVTDLVVDSQVKHNVSNSFIAVWPTDPDSIVDDPTQTIDYCLSFTVSFFFPILVFLFINFLLSYIFFIRICVIIILTKFNVPRSIAISMPVTVVVSLMRNPSVPADLTVFPEHGLRKSLPILCWLVNMI